MIQIWPTVKVELPKPHLDFGHNWRNKKVTLVPGTPFAIAHVAGWDWCVIRMEREDAAIEYVKKNLATSLLASNFALSQRRREEVVLNAS